MMKTKKLSLFLIFSNAVLLLACILLLVLLLRPGASGSFQPLSTQVDDFAKVGKMRLPEIYTKSDWLETTDSSRVKFEFIDFTPGDPSLEGEEGYGVVRINQTVKKQEYVESCINFWLLYFCPEDGFWYALYNPSHAIAGVNLGDVGPFERTVTCKIPPELTAQPGLYALAFENVGCCQFEIE